MESENPDIISCLCGKDFAHEEFKDHYIICNLFSEEMSSVTSTVNQYIKNNQNVQKWKNLKGYFRWAYTYIDRVIEKRTVESPQNGSNGDKKIRIHGGKLLPGGHQIHQVCLKVKVLADLKKYKDTCCNECKEEISLAYLNNALGVKEMNLISEELMDSKLNKEIFCCIKCEGKLQIDEDKPNEKEKDRHGNLVSKEAAIQKAKFMYKCSQCQTEGCANCKASPYHSGYTCQQNSNEQKEIRCKYCYEVIDSSDEILKKRKCCSKLECEMIYQDCCQEKLSCGHEGKGSSKDKDHMPCLNEEGVEKDPNATNGENGGSFCSIGQIDGLEDKPGVKLGCGHIFHAACVINNLKPKWLKPYITFDHLKGSACKSLIKSRHSEIVKIFKKEKEFKDKVDNFAYEEAKKEDISKSEYNAAPYNGDLKAFAEDKMAIYVGYQCNELYGGGRKEGDERDIKRDELKCKNGKEKKGIITREGGEAFTKCKNDHSSQNYTYKCRFCCSSATFFGWGDTHFCDSGHERQDNGEYIDEKTPDELPQCGGKDKCPLKISHPPNGTEDYAYICLLCES